MSVPAEKLPFPESPELLQNAPVTSETRHLRAVPLPPEGWIFDPDNTNGPTWVYSGAADMPNPDVARDDIPTYEPRNRGRVYTCVGSAILGLLDR